MLKFVHFRMYTEYSIYKSILRLKEIISEIKKDDQKSVCISDENNIFNCPRFYKECFKNKIKPLIGCSLNFKIKKKSYNIILVSKNYNGYINISKLLSKSNIYNKSYIEFEWFKGILNKGLFIILNINEININKNFFKILKDFKKIKKIFKNKVYIEIQKIKNYKKILKISNLLKLPLLATNPISFLNKDDFQAYNAKIFMYNKDYNKKKLLKNHYFYKQKKMIKIFKKIPSSIKNTYELSKKCNLELNFNKLKLPFFKLKKNLSNNSYFINLLFKKLKKNIKKKNYKDYKKRLINELCVIIKMNLCDYFLIVKDFIKWSKKKNIQVGPGRGSSNGSLVSFLLNITELDPIKYNLLFERFLNIEKISIPDFDVDFCQKDREKVTEYIKKKYGINFVSQIITFNRINLKSSIKDIGKFLNFNYDFINEINKLISFNYNLNILETLKKNKNFYNKYKNNKKLKILINLNNKLEGLLKNISVHAGGIIISPNKIFYYSPILIHNNIILNNYFKDDLEELGILKFDFLGLITLSIIKNTLKKIKKRINFSKIKLNNKLCYNNFKNANTIGVFQLESLGIRKVLKILKPDNFENIIAVISLYRPGPIKLIKEFCLRKQNKKKINYIDSKIKDFLKETYGIIIYQEQIMQIVRVIANYTLNDADNLRKIISKKKHSDMIKEEKNFVEKSLKNNISYKKSLYIFKIIKEFVNYGFNKSHAAAYALLSYKTMWLKSYYGDYFMSSNMSYYYNDNEKLNLIIKDSITNNLYILPLNINLSTKNFSVIENSKNKKIRYGFKGVLGLGFNIIKNILKVRKLKPFKNFLDFYNRVDKRIVNYKSIELLISSGAFDNLNYNRSNLIKKLNILSTINLIKEKIKVNIIKNLYLNKNYFWNFKKKILEEKNALGFFFLNNIYNIYKKKIINCKIKKELEKGIVININEKLINNNFIINIFNWEKNNIEIRINKNLFKMNINFIKKNNLIIFYKKEINNKIFVQKILNIKNIF